MKEEKYHDTYIEHWEALKHWKSLNENLPLPVEKGSAFWDNNLWPPIFYSFDGEHWTKTSIED